MYFESWTYPIASTLENVWYGVISFLPTLIGAFIVFLVGLIVASGLSTLVQKIFEGIKLDQFLRRLGLAPFFERAGMEMNGSLFLARLVFWFIVIVFLLAVSDTLGLFALSGFLREVLFYIPNVIIAAAIMLASFVIGNFLRRLVTASVMSARLNAGRFLGTLTYWSVIVFGFLSALVQLNVAVSIIQTLVTGFIAMLALAGGLAFGLGGRDYAAHLIEKLREHTESSRHRA